MTRFLFVYGTLRNRNWDGRCKSLGTVLVDGLLYNLGWFPGIHLGIPCDGQAVVCEKLEVVDQSIISELDRYEGYYEDDPANSLYIRRPYLDGEIYEYNGTPPVGSLIRTGDWLNQ